MAQVDLEALWRDQAQGLFAFLAYRTNDRALAEDLLADTFERALKARRRFDRRRGSERTWLYAIALNLLRDHQRRAATEARAVEEAAPVAESGDHADALADRD
ncbi:MAG TPA: sigma factor, partial [Solirubrobacteraceae bacterium]